MSVDYNEDDKDTGLVPSDWVTTIIVVVLWLIIVFSAYVVFLIALSRMLG